MNWARFGGGRPGGTGRAFARPGEDYRADFYLIARRYLRAAEWELFQLHMLEGRPWRECAAKVRMSRGNLFHSIYRIERNLGRIYLTLKPYALFPLDEYFASAVRRQQ